MGGREFLATALAVVALASPGSAQRPSGERYGVSLGNAVAFAADYLGGGSAMASVVVEKVGPDGIAHKHLGGVEIEAIELRLGLGDAARSVFEMIPGVLGPKHSRKDGSIVTCAPTGNPSSRLDFFHALVTEVGFPALDAGSKDPLFMTIKLAPETTREKKAQSKDACPKSDKPTPAANFRLELAGLDPAGVVRIDPFAIKQQVVVAPRGEVPSSAKLPNPVGFPNLRVYIAESKGEAWKKWHLDFVVAGKNDQQQEKEGALVFLAPDLKTEVARITLKSVGIFRLARERPDPASTQPRRLVADLYVEQMTLEGKK